MNSKSYYKKKSLISIFIEMIVTIIIALFISVFFVSNVLTITQIKEQSMEATFVEDDRVIVNKTAYLIGSPFREDVVILDKVNNEKGIIINMINESKSIIANIKYRFTGNIEKNRLLKRVIALEGDIIDIREGYVYLNGKKLEEDYVNNHTYPRYGLSYPVEVPQGKVFVLGDNREYSLDSRDFGFIDLEQIKGKVVFRVFPFSKFGKIN